MSKDFYVDLMKLVCFVLITFAFFVMGAKSGEHKMKQKAVQAGVGEFTVNQSNAVVSFRWLTPTNAVK